MAKKRSRVDGTNGSSTEAPNNDDVSSFSTKRMDCWIAFLGVLLAVSFGVLMGQVRDLWVELQGSDHDDDLVAANGDGRGVARISLNSDAITDNANNKDDDAHVEMIQAHVDRNEPFVCRLCLPPASLWGWWDNDANLLKVMDPKHTNLMVRVAERSNDEPTQFTRATAPGMKQNKGSAYKETNMTAAEFFESYRDTQKDHLLYLAQVDVTSNFPDLLPYIFSTAPHSLVEAVGPTPPASQRPFTVYLGSGLRTTQTHYDSLENVVCVVSGGFKTFELYDPFTASKLLYVDRTLHGNGSPVPPHGDAWKEFPMSKYALPSIVTLFPGDCLYLPVYWYHSVTSSPERTVSLNYWRMPNPKKMSILEKLFCGRTEDSDASAKCN